MSEKNKKILIVEDDGFISEVYMTKLGAEGFDVVIATEGEEALRLVKSESPDLILLDLFLPKLSGVEILRSLNLKNDDQKVSVVVLTNAEEKDYRQDIMDLGADDYLVKSNYTPDEVVLKIKNFLE